MTRLWIAVLVMFPLAAPAQSEPPPTTEERTQLGSLSRAAAGIQNVLDVHRLALGELVPATHLLREAGEAPGASLDAPIPEVPLEVFSRLARVVPLRAASEALPAISRGYHAEVLEALEQLAAARVLGETGAPLRELARALAGLERGAQDVVDLFSRQRPVLVQIVDPETALDDVNEALDEVAAAEQRIGDLRASAATPADQLRAFMRLEIALGHALDLIAAAEESGVRVGFDAQKPTLTFRRVVAEFAALRLALGESVEDLSRSPTVELNELRALETSTMSEDGNHRQRTIDVTWAAAGVHGVAALRVERFANVDDIATTLVHQTLCDGASYAQAVDHGRRADYQPSLTQLPDTPVAAGTYRASYTEPAGESAIRADIVLTPVNAFGIAGKPARVTAAYMPRQVGEPRALHAELPHFDTRDVRFYRDYDAVHVRWSKAIGDLAPDQRVMGMARSRDAAVVRGYRIARLSGQRAIVIGKTDAGVTEIIDRPSLAELAEGVSYRVTAIASRGAEVASSETCLARLRVDIREDVQVARAGAGSLSRPASFERVIQHELESDVTLSKARAVFEMRSPEAREELLSRWWTSVPLRERLSWLAHWPTFMTPEERDVWLVQGHRGFAARDFDEWVLPELFLADQPEQVRGEVDRWWSLVGVKARTVHYNAWIRHLSSSHRAYVERAAHVGGEQGHDATRPLRVMVWWASRGEAERQRARLWWERLDDSSRQLRIQAWMGHLNPVVQVSVRWPDLEVRAPDERDALVATAYRQLPSGLWRLALASTAWQVMDTPTRLRVVRSEVSAPARLIARVAYAARPLDRALGFNLRSLLVLTVFATLFAMAVRRIVRSRGALKLRKLPVVEAFERVVDSARVAGAPAVAIPGVLEVNDPHTLAGLHLVDRAADIAATRESTLVVADRDPFVRHVGLAEGVSGAGYALDEIQALASPTMPFVPSARDVVTQTTGAAAIFVGRLPSETLLVSDALRGDALTVTATAVQATLALAHTRSDHVFTGDELTAAAADMSRDPTLLTTVLATDWMKYVILATLGALMLAATFGAFG